jgi:hypothetical protein
VRRHGVCFAQAVDVRVVVVLSRGAQNEKISTISFVTEPSKCLIQIAAAAHHGNAKPRLGLDVAGISESEVFVGLRVRETESADEDYQGEPNTYYEHR